MYRNLLAEMKRHNPEIFKRDIAETLGITYGTLKNRMDKNKLTTEDIIKIRNVFFSGMDIEYLCKTE